MAQSCLVAGSERLADAVSDARRERRLGMALVAGAAVAWSTAGFFTRLLPYDAWTILFWRGVFGCAFTAAFLVASQRGDWRSVFQPNHDVADWTVADIDHHSADGDDRLTRRRDHVRSHLIDADADKRRRSGLAGSRARCNDGPGEHYRKPGHDADRRDKAQPAGPAELGRNHGPGP